MPAPLTELAELYAFNTGMIDMFVAQMDEPAWLHVVEQASSNPYWVLGHVTHYRALLLGKLDGAMTSPLDAFAIGTTPPTVIDPPVEQIVDLFKRCGEGLVKLIPQLTDEQLAADSGRKFSHGNHTVAGMLHFLIFHESYHLGQISVVNRAVGNPGLGR